MKKFLLFLMFALFCIPWVANAQQSLPYSYGFEDNNLATDGWSSTSGAINTAAKYTGTYGFRFSYSVSEDVYLMSPILSGGTYGVNLSFWYKAYSGSYLDHFYVGYTTDENVTDPSEFTYGSMITSTTSWQEYTETLPARTVRVAIKYDADNYDDGYYLYLDDFTFTAASSCAAPTNTSVTYSDGDATATVTWRGDARSYNVDVNGIIEAVTGTSYTISNLTPATTYAVKVQADCGEEQSAWVNAGSFSTPCPDSYAIPYAYDFEDAGAMDCWTQVETELSNGYMNQSGNTYANTGNGCYYFSSYNGTTDPQYFISPELSGTENGVHVEFWYRKGTNGEESFKVGYSTTTNDVSSFQWDDEVTSLTATYQQYKVNYMAPVKYVAIQYTGSDSYYMFIDDISFTEAPSCLEPTSVVVSNETTTGATISWTAGASEEAWDIFVTDDATIVPEETTTPTEANVATNSFNLTGLTPATIYYVYVRAICSETQASAWTSVTIFNTECEAMALPYSYNFNDGAMSVCWSTYTTSPTYTGIELAEADEDDYVLMFFRGTSNADLAVVLPEVDATYPLNGYQITFDAAYYNGTSYSMTSGKLGIGIMTDPNDFTTFELIEEVTLDKNYNSAGFGTYTVMFSNYTGSGQYIAIKNIHTANGYVLVDNIEVTELPSCLPPTNLTVEGGKNAVVTWEGDAESFDIAYSTDNTVDPADNILDNTTENTFNLGEAVDLTEGDYYVWVRANCGTDGYSEWTAPVSFHVGYCTPNPTSHDGKGITGVSFGMGNYVVTNGDGSASLPTSAPYYGDYTSMIGAVQAGVESTIAITTGTNSFPYTFVIWVDLDNSMSFEDNDIVYIGKASSGNGTLNATITIPATQTLGDYRMRIYGADSYFTSFYGSGTTNWTADHDPCSSGSYRHAHDYTLRVLEAPSCLAAGDVTVAPENITSTSAVITWTNNNGEEATYTVMQGETVLTTTAVDSYTLTLTPSTSYPAGTFTIISDCDENAIANVPAFSTLCDDITALPWSENFESFASNTVPNCWDNSASTSSISNSSSSPNCIWGVVTVSGNNMIKMENYWANSGTALINTPTIVLPAEGAYQLAFDYAHNADCGAFAVKVSTDNGTTFTELASYTKGSGTSHEAPGDFTPATISLADYAGESIILQFFANATYGNGAIFVDNVAVEEIPGCYKILVDADNPEWSEDFEDDAAGITTPYTGILPACWYVPVEYTSAEGDVTPPQVYYKPEFNATENGSYSLRMRYRSMLAMPELDENVDFEHLKMGLYVRQSFWSYKLEIGVVTDIDDPDNSYHLVATVNNPDKNVDYFECNFSSVNDLTGPGRYIVFKNVGGSEGDLYSNNYLDDITLTYIDVEELDCQLYSGYEETFEGYQVGTEPDCWEVISADVELESATRPQVYANYNTTPSGSKSLRLKNRCIYAMPEFQTDNNVGDFTMTFQLRQPNSLYRLQVGVVDEQGEFTQVQTLKCNGTEFEEKTVNFAGYEGRIAFRNTLVPGTGMRTDYLDYSYNYIDDININLTEGSKINANDENVLDSDLESIAVYPNPTTGNLYIDAIGIQKVECYNAMGQLVRMYDNVRNSIDLNNLSEGVYTLRITVPQGVTMRKVVKR